MKEKIKKLNNKTLYRLLKVIYWFSFVTMIIILMFFNIDKYSELTSDYILLAYLLDKAVPLLVLSLFFILLKKIFYYVILGEPIISSFRKNNNKYEKNN